MSNDLDLWWTCFRMFLLFRKEKLSKFSKLPLSKQCVLVIIFQKKPQFALILIGACAVNGLNTVHLKIILCIQYNIYIPIKFFVKFCILYEYGHFTWFRLLFIQFTLAHCVIFFNLLTNDNATIQYLLTHSFPCTQHHRYILSLPLDINDWLMLHFKSSFLYPHKTKFWGVYSPESLCRQSVRPSPFFVRPIILEPLVDGI